MILYFGLKVPFGLQCCAHVCLAKRFGLAFFSKAHDTLVAALLFGGLLLLPEFLQSFIQSVFVPPLQPGRTWSWKGLHVSTSGWAVFLTLPLMRDYILFPGKARAAGFLLFILVRRCCRQSWKNGSVFMRQPSAFVFCFGLPSASESSTKLRIHPSITLVRAKPQLFPSHTGHCY